MNQNNIVKGSTVHGNMVGIDVTFPNVVLTSYIPVEPPPNLSREQQFVPPGEEGDDPRHKTARYW